MAAEGILRELKRRRQTRWSAKNRQYWAERRLHAQIERAARAPSEEVARPPPACLAELPVEVIEQVFSRSQVAVVVFLARLLVRATQDADGGPSRRRSSGSRATPRRKTQDADASSRPRNSEASGQTPSRARASPE